MSTEDDKKIALRVAKFKSFFSNFEVNQKGIEYVLQGLDLNLMITNPSSLKEHDPENIIGQTLLHMLFRENELDVYNILISMGADFTIKNKYGTTVLYEAFTQFYNFEFELKWNFKTSISNSRSRFIAPTLSHHIISKNTNNPASPCGITHFHIACATGHVDAVQFFLNNGEPINQVVAGFDQNSLFEGYTALHFAVHFSNIMVTRMLLTQGANDQIQDAKGRTPLHICLERNIKLKDFSGEMSQPENVEASDQIMMLLLNQNTNSKFLCLLAASSMKNPSEVERLLLQGIDINESISEDSQAWQGCSAIHFAARVNVTLVKFLIVRGANIEAKEANNLTAFDMCINRYRVKHIFDIVCLVPKWKNILMSNAEIKLTEVLLALRNLDAIKLFLKQSSENIKLFVPHDSPLWPGFTILHLAILFTERKECKADYEHSTTEVLFQPDMTILEELLKQEPNVIVKDSRNWTAIHLAYRLGKYKSLDLLLQHQHKISNCVDDENLSHLHIACAVGNENLAKKLVWNEADVNIVYKGDKHTRFVYPGWTPLHVAIYRHNVNIVKLLLKFGADVHVKDTQGFTPIHALLQIHFLKISQIILDTANLTSDVVVEGLGLSYLHVACSIGNINVVKRLLDCGANVNQRINVWDPYKYPFNSFNSDGETPLELVLNDFMTGTIPTEITRLIITRGADLLERNLHGKLSLMYIFKYEDEDAIEVIIDILRDNDELRKRFEMEIGVTLLHFACAKDDVNLVKELLDNGADVNAQMSDNLESFSKNTCLHVLLSKQIILSRNVQQILNLLLEHNADVTLTNANNHTPLHMVYNVLLINDNYSYRDMINVLLQAHKKYDVNPTTNEGFSHFHIACHMLNADVVENFLENGAVDVNATIHPFCDNSVAACSPLHLATIAENSNQTSSMLISQLRIVDLLIKQGADVNAEDTNGNTPAHNTLSCSVIRENPFQRLVSGGANVNARNVQGETPLEIVLKKTNFSLVEVRYYITIGCQLNAFNIVTEKGYIALCHALLSHEDMILLLMGTCMNFPNQMKDETMNRTAVHNLVSIHFSETTDKQYVDLFGILMKYGCDIDDRDNQGRTALHLATLFKNVSAIEGLLLAGADINIMDNNGKTAFAYIFEPCCFCSVCLGVSEISHPENAHSDVLQILMRQIKKMEYCDIYVNRSNEILMVKAFHIFHSNDFTDNLSDILDEIMGIVNFKVEPYSLNVTDFLSNNAVAVLDYPMMSRAKRKAIDNFFRSNRETFEIRYRNIAGILQLQYRQAVQRRQLMNAATASLSELMKIQVPDICSYIILRSLKNFEIKNLISSTIPKAQLEA